MRARHRQKIWMKQDIIINREKVGRLCLVDYLTGKATPHLEYYLDEPYQNMGIMSKELPKYLKLCKKYDVYQMIAVVKTANLPSIKLLERNGFIKVKEIGDNTSYLIDLRLTPDIVESMIKKVKSAFNHPNKDIYE